MKATIRDVAKMANVSVATVSRVINNKGYVHSETKRIVLSAIEELGFEPNQLARSLTNRHSKMIGVIVPHVSTAFYGELIEGIEEAAVTYGYKVMLCNSKDNPERELEYIKIFEQYNVEGIVFAANIHNKERVKNLKIPVVSVDHFFDSSVPSITSNNEEGGRLAAKLLMKNGCKNFLLLRGPSFLMTTIERTKGFVDEVEAEELNYIIHDCDILNPDVDSIYNFLKNNPQIDGIFALADSLAIVSLGVLKKLNVDVPNQCQLVGFDDVNYTKWAYPGITTISQPIKYMGSEALHAVVKLINNEELASFHREIPIDLIVRETTK